MSTNTPDRADVADPFGSVEYDCLPQRDLGDFEDATPADTLSDTEEYDVPEECTLCAMFSADQGDCDLCSTPGFFV